MSVLKDKQQLSAVAAVLTLAGILLWPAFVNGEPFYMTDTSSYVRGADAAAHRLTGARTVWTDVYLQRFAPEAATAPSSSAQTSSPVVLTGRSIYYGYLLYVAQSFGNFWSMVILQALLVATSIGATISVLRQNRRGQPTAASILVVGGLLAVLTPVGYFVSYLMPDVFGGLGLLAFAHLVFLWDQNSRLGRAFWFALLSAALLFHGSNFLLIGVLAVAAGIGLFLRLPARKAGLAAVVAALILSIAGQALFGWGVKQASGAAPVRPPFIAARIIADGPGYEYLREHCPKVGLIYCRAVGFRARVSDALLWSTDPQLGIFQALSPAEQRVAAAQEKRFVIAVLIDRPLDLIGSSIGSIGRQLGHFDLQSFNYAPVNIDYFNRKIPPPFIDHARRSKAFHNAMPVKFVERATIVTVLIALLSIAGTVWMMVRPNRRLAPTGAFLSFLVAGVLLNAAICGALSTPKGRYQMRLIWVLPLAALATRKLGSRGPFETGEAGTVALAPERKSAAAG